MSNLEQEKEFVKKQHSQKQERRTFTANFKLETREEGQEVFFVGHASVFNQRTDLGWFDEMVSPGAFKDSIGVDDVRALFNHDPNFVLGRNKSGTLELREDEKGLWTKIIPPDTQTARDLKVLIERGDIDQMSFGFEILEREWRSGEGKENDLQVLKKVRLWDVSPVTFPAYKQTDIGLSVRSHLDFIGSVTRETPTALLRNKLRRAKLH